MISLAVVRYLHLLAAATWLGGLVVLGPLVIALRRSGATREQLRAAARAFAWTTWIAMGIAVATGLGQVWLLGLPWSYTGLRIKVAAVGAAVGVAAVHHVAAPRLSDRTRRVTEVGILAATLAVYAAAVAL